MTMDIHSKPGTKVRFAFPKNGWEHDIEHAAEYLTEGSVYTVLRTEIHSWHTKVYFEEMPLLAFNSVQFEPVE